MIYNKEKRSFLMAVATKDGVAERIEFTVYYDVGGMNYFTGNVKARGYYITAQPIARTKNSVSFRGFSEVSSLYKKTRRFSKKTLEKIAHDQETLEKALSLATLARIEGSFDEYTLTNYQLS